MAKKLAAPDSWAAHAAGDPRDGEEHGRSASIGGPLDPRTKVLEVGRPAGIGRGSRLDIGRSGAVDGGKGSHADDRCSAMVHIVAAGLARGGDVVVDDSGFDGGAETARRFDLLEHIPCPIGELVGEPLDVPRPAGGVDDSRRRSTPSGEHRLSVAGEAPAQLTRLRGGDGVVREDGDRIGTAGRPRRSTPPSLERCSEPARSGWSWLGT